MPPEVPAVLIVHSGIANPDFTADQPYLEELQRQLEVVGIPYWAKPKLAGDAVGLDAVTEQLRDAMVVLVLA